MGSEVVFIDVARDLLVILAVLLSAYLLYRLVQYKKRTGGYTALWGSVFEALTHYVQPQESLKEPEQLIVRSHKKSGEDYDDDDNDEQ